MEQKGRRVIGHLRSMRRGFVGSGRGGGKVRWGPKEGTKIQIRTIGQQGLSYSCLQLNYVSRNKHPTHVVW